MQRRGVATLVGFLALSAISIALISGIVLWALPNIQKAQNQDEAMRIENRMIELHNAIKIAANEQTKLSVPFYIKKGRLAISTNGTENNSVIFTSNLKLPIPYNQRVLLGNKTEVGILGVDEPAYAIEGGAFEVKLHYIMLNDTATKDCYRIQLKHGMQSAIGPGDHMIAVRWDGEINDQDLATHSGCYRNITQVVMIDMI